MIGKPRARGDLSELSRAVRKRRLWRRPLEGRTARRERRATGGGEDTGRTRAARTRAATRRGWPGRRAPCPRAGARQRSVMQGVLCYIIRVIVAVPDADAGSMPAPTGGGTHPLNHCQQREYQRISDHCAGPIQARPCALLPPSCVTLMRHPEHAYGPSTSCLTGAGASHRSPAPKRTARRLASSSGRSRIDAIDAEPDPRRAPNRRLQRSGGQRRVFSRRSTAAPVCEHSANGLLPFCYPTAHYGMEPNGTAR